jgi:hypothetical protein
MTDTTAYGNLAAVAAAGCDGQSRAVSHDPRRPWLATGATNRFNGAVISSSVCAYGILGAPPAAIQNGCRLVGRERGENGSILIPLPLRCSNLNMR